MKDEQDSNKIIELGENQPIPSAQDLNILKENEINTEDNQDQKKNILPTISNQIFDSNEPRISGIEDILEGDDNILNQINNPYIQPGRIDDNFSKYLYITKDILFILFLLISSGLNYSYLYLPFFLLVFFSYFSLLQTGKNNKRFKRIIEIFSLVYAVGLLAFKLYFVISVKTGKDFGDNKQLLIDLGILNLLNEDSIYFLIASFIGEVFVIIISIFSIIISYNSIDVNVGLNDDSDDNGENELTLNKLYSLMTRCVYLFYFCIVGWSIFNRSILTLIYLMPLNIILYLLAMNHKKNIIFIVFIFFSMILSIVIFTHLVLINIFNIGSIRDYYITPDLEIRDDYPRVVNFWTKMGINQAFHVDMKGKKIAEEFFGYFFGCLALIVLMYTNKQLTFSRFRKAKINSVLDNEEIDIEDEYDYNFEEIYFMNFWEKCWIYIKKFLYNPSFILHICRISAILWLYYYQNFYSIGVIIWLFFSFLYLRVASNKIVTIVFLAPMVFVCLFCYHLANIDGFIENKGSEKIYRNFALGKFTHKNVEYILCNIFYFLITIFIYTLFRITRFKTLKKEEVEAISDKDKLKAGVFQQKEEDEMKIHNDDNDEEINTNSNQDDNNNNKELDEFEKKATEVNDLFKDESKDVKEEAIEELYNNLTIVNIIIKAIFSNIDKITLIILYFLAVYSINIVHFILVIIFMMQLLFPEFMVNHSIIFIIFSQIIFLIEYCVDLSKNIEYSNKTVNLIKLFIPFELKEISIDFLLYLMTYAYYAQNQLFHSEFFNKIGYDENISLNIYVKVNFHKYPLLQKILFAIGNVIREIYVWALIAIFIVFNGLFELSIFFAINLLLFLFIVYNFLNNVKNQKKSEINLALNWVFLYFCVLSTISVYLFQIMCLDIFISGNDGDDKDNDIFKVSSHFFVRNLPAMGFYRYFNKKLHLKFLPHFISNLISKLFITEMKNLINKNEKKEPSANIQIEENFKKKKYELLIEHKITLDNKKVQKELEERNKSRTDSEIVVEIETNENKNKETDKKRK